MKPSACRVDEYSSVSIQPTSVSVAIQHIKVKIAPAQKLLT